MVEDETAKREGGGLPNLGPGRLRIHSSMISPAKGGTPELAEMYREIPETSPLWFMAEINYELRRVERYLALFAGFRIPVEAELESVESFAFHYSKTEVFLTSSQRWELPEEIGRIYRAAELLLDKVKADSLLGKAIENIGESALDEDPDLRFVHAWNGIELLARVHYLAKNPSVQEVASDGQRTRPPNPRDSISLLLKEFHDGPLPPDLDWLTYLRNGSAHGGLSDYPGASFKEFAERWDKSEAMRDLAKESLVNLLGSRGVIPAPPRPFHPRIMVPSYQANMKIEPVDESDKLSRKGVDWDA